MTSVHYRLYDKQTDSFIYSKLLGLKEFWSIYESEPSLQNTLDKEIFDDIYTNDIAYLTHHYGYNVIFKFDEDNSQFAFELLHQKYTYYNNKGCVRIPPRYVINVYGNTYQTDYKDISTYEEPAILSEQLSR